MHERETKQVETSCNDADYVHIDDLSKDEVLHPSSQTPPSEKRTASPHVAPSDASQNTTFRWSPETLHRSWRTLTFEDRRMCSNKANVSARQKSKRGLACLSSPRTACSRCLFIFSSLFSLLFTLCSRRLNYLLPYSQTSRSAILTHSLTVPNRFIRRYGSRLRYFSNWAIFIAFNVFRSSTHNLSM